MAAGARFARAKAVPVIADPLISAYDKQVDERRKFSATSFRGRRLLRWERGLLQRMDRVVVDTLAHAEYFSSVLGVDPSRLVVVPVGADESLFSAEPLPSRLGGFEVLFYGSFVPLQGAEIIVSAAGLVEHSDVHITLLGGGPTHQECVRRAKGVPRVRFEPWMDYRLLPGRIHRAHLCLGVFGGTPKAGRVIANKIYQSLASGRPVITRKSAAYPAELREAHDDALHFVEAADPSALAASIDELAGMDLDNMHVKSRNLYDRYFSRAAVIESMAALLKSLGLPAGRH
jgi:glycosyltransferase involved in cell wall biosynthesis